MERELHQEYKKTIIELCHKNAWQVYEEVRIPNNKIADILALNRIACIYIFEIKTTINFSLINEAIQKYKSYCDSLYIVADNTEIREMMRGTNHLTWKDNTSKIGLIGIERGTPLIIRRPEPIEPSRTAQRELLRALKTCRPVW